MDNLKIYTQSDIDALITPRNGETRIGEKVRTVASLDELNAVSAKFVLLGIPEDIGVRANLGIGGASTAWLPALKAFLSLQHNDFMSGSNNMVVLGHFDVLEPVDGSTQGLRSKVNEIDTLVYPVIQKITAAGKIPIIIGGGHNNACPIITGVALGLAAKINTINIDAHADLRPVSEGRHSGNGFSAAIQHGYLDTYAVFGLHENYNNQYILDTIAGNPKIKALFFDEMLKQNKPLHESWQAFIAPLLSPCGLEIDLDSIENTLSSATTPSGFTLNEIRQLILSTKKGFAYLHICEGAIRMADGRESSTTAKAIAYLVSDFVKTHS